MRRLVVLVALVGTLAACSSAAKTAAGNAAGSLKTAASSAGSSAASAASSAAGAAGQQVSSAVGGAASNLGTKPPSFSGSSSSQYCDYARQIQNSTKLKDPANLKAAFAEFDSVAPKFVSLAPSAIKADAQTLVDSARSLEKALQAANWDVTKVDPTALQTVQDPKVQASNDRVDAYDAQVCGLGSGSGSATSTP